jgi:hypothetical protein
VPSSDGIVVGVVVGGGGTGGGTGGVYDGARPTVASGSVADAPWLGGPVGTSVGGSLRGLGCTLTAQSDVACGSSVSAKYLPS